MDVLSYIAATIALRMQSSRITELLSSLAPIVLADDIGNIVAAIGMVQGYIVTIATALVVLMISIAGFMIIIDREAATIKRGERLAFIKSILLGYGIILGANLLISLLITVMKGISGHATPTVPGVNHP